MSAEIEWPEKRKLVKDSPYLQYDKGYNHCHDEFMEIIAKLSLKQPSEVKK
jgi:hypothetical protein